MRIRFTVLGYGMVKRLFVALDLPEDLARRLADLDPGIDGLRWTPAGRLHITLCFLGNVDEEAHGRLIESLADVASEPFSLRMKGCGCFTKHGGLVLWAGIDDRSDALPLLHRKVARAVRAAGLDPGPSRLQPHLTLARARHGKPAMVREFVDAHVRKEFGEFTVDGVTLYSSELRSEGPSYHEEYRRSFSASPA